MRMPRLLLRRSYYFVRTTYYCPLPAARCHEPNQSSPLGRLRYCFFLDWARLFEILRARADRDGRVARRCGGPG